MCYLRNVGLCSKKVDLLLTFSRGSAVLSRASPLRRAEHGTWRIRPGLHRGHHPCRGPAGTAARGPLAELPPPPLPALRPAVPALQPGPPHLARPRQPAPRPAAPLARGLLPAPLPPCRRYFTADLSDLAPPGATTPIGSSPWPSGWWSRTACPIRPPVGTSGATTASSSPSPPSRTGSRRGGKKAAAQVETDYLDWALADFSGYLAADELYDGPFCVLSIVDTRLQAAALRGPRPRPDPGGHPAFFGRFQAAAHGPRP